MKTPQSVGLFSPIPLSALRRIINFTDDPSKFARLNRVIRLLVKDTLQTNTTTLQKYCANLLAKGGPAPTSHKQSTSIKLPFQPLLEQQNHLIQVFLGGLDGVHLNQIQVFLNDSFLQQFPKITQRLQVLVRLKQKLEKINRK